MDGAGDVNADGYADFVVGSESFARVFSGKDASVLHNLTGNSGGEDFGQAVSGAGDVNADGYADVIVGARNASITEVQSGSARVFSGKDGSLIHEFNGEAFSSNLGSSVSGTGDVNGDGYDDVMAATDSGCVFPYAARVYSGKDGVELYALAGDRDWGGQFGNSISDAGDVNGDGYPDLIAGGSSKGKVRVYSGIPLPPPAMEPSGELIYSIEGNLDRHFLGRSVSGAGDINSDGFDDFIVGEPGTTDEGRNAGRVHAFSGKDGSILHTVSFPPEEEFSLGNVVRGVGDVNCDGIPDFAAQCRGEDNNGFLIDCIRVFSGQDGVPIFTAENRFGGGFGDSFSGAGDINADGYADIIVGTAFSRIAHVFSGKDGALLYLKAEDEIGRCQGSCRLKCIHHAASAAA